ncbi:MAG TPA: ATP-binding protein [Flavisolibacter sp.]|jgi:signal transduction histidine kinase|nr:ATP-binding protein [Flavisolibacter sp.]
MDAQETRIYTLVLILVVVIGAIIAYFFISMIRQHRINLALKQQNITTELASMERERARIAADLHDELSPLVSAIKLKVSSFDLHDKEDQLQQQKTDEHLDDVVRRLREISFNLMPVTLQRKGLVAAMKELTNYVSNQNGLRIEVVTDELYPDASRSIHLYRIVQEIVHNTIKHAGATLLQLSLKMENDKLILSSKDNGRGFHYDQQLKDGSGYGLRNLLSRTDVLGGELFVETAPGTGTKYTIEVPVETEQTKS